MSSLQYDFYILSTWSSAKIRKVSSSFFMRWRFNLVGTNPFSTIKVGRTSSFIRNKSGTGKKSVEYLQIFVQAMVAQKNAL